MGIPAAGWSFKYILHVHCKCPLCLKRLSDREMSSTHRVQDSKNALFQCSFRHAVFHTASGFCFLSAGRNEGRCVYGHFPSFRHAHWPLDCHHCGEIFLSACLHKSLLLPDGVWINLDGKFPREKGQEVWQCLGGSATTLKTTCH